MTTDVDIANRALQLVGTRTTIASLSDNTNEAIQCNLCYTAIRDWCHSIENWNFARKTVALASAKSVALPIGTWTTASPAPPWLNEYTVPGDFIRAIYVTNMNHNNNPATSYDGEPQRFAVATDTIAALQQEVILTNQGNAILTYTSRVSDPTLWPLFFERVVVSAVARTICLALTQSMQLFKILEENAIMMITQGVLLNRAEGLAFEDTTPEWVNARGIVFPERQMKVIKAVDGDSDGGKR